MVYDYDVFYMSIFCYIELLIDYSNYVTEF